MKKVLAMILAVAMVIGMAPAAFAAGTTALPEAVDGTITLTKDVTLSSYVKISDTVTIDLNGYTITATESTDRADEYGAIYVASNGKLTIVDNSTKKTGAIVSSSYAIGNFGTVTIESGSFTGGYAALYNFWYNNTTYGKATINGGSLNAVWNSGDLTVEAGTLEYVDSTSKMTLNGGTIDELLVKTPDYAGLGLTTTIDEDVEIGALIATTYKDNNDEQEKNNLAQAVAAARNGDTVKLLKSVTVDETINITKDVTINLNGKVITSTVAGARLFEINAASPVAFKIVGTTAGSAINSEGGGHGIVRASSADASISIEGGSYTYNTPNGAVIKTVAANTSVDVKNAAITTNNWVMDCGNSYIAKLNVEGGTYTSTGNPAFIVDCEDDAVVSFKNATISAAKAGIEVGGDSENAVNAIVENCTVTTTGATGAVNASYGSTVTIKSGTYTGAQLAAGAYDTNGKLVIQGGAFNGAVDKIVAGGAGGDISIEGGTFSTDPSAYVADGYVVKDNGNGTYTVAEKVAAKLTTDIGDKTFVAGGDWVEFTFSTVANDDAGVMVYGGSDFGVAYEDTIAGLEFKAGDQWIDMKGQNFGGDAGFPMANATSTFRVKFTADAAGSYTFNAAMKTVDGDNVLCTLAVPFTVAPYVAPSAPPVVTPTPDPEPVVPEAPSVDTDSPVVDSTTKENEDGSTTKEETLENGTKVETTTNTDGSKTETATKTDTVETEESKTTTTTTVTTNTSATGETVKESTEEVKVENADGSATTTTTTVTETEKKTEKVEVKEETVVKEDGTTETKTTATTETALADGSKGTTTTDETGKVEAEVTVSNAAVTEAAKEEKPVELAMPAVEAAKPADEVEAPTVTVDLPAGTTTATVAIPVAEGTGAGAVAVIVNADGTETVITESVVTENGLEVEVPDGATIKVVDNSEDFNDVAEDDWHNDAVDFNSARNIMNGVEGNNFAPTVTTTRAMVWTMLARLAGVDTTPAEGEEWWEAGQKWAMANGVSDGTNGDGEITREQLATMLYRFVGSPDHDHEIDHFHDHHETSDWALEGKQWAVGNGVINGKEAADGTLSLDPTGEATRAEVAQMFMNFIANV